MKKKFLFPFLCFILLLLIGIGLMLYPLISNWYGERVRSTVEVQYNEAIAKLEDESIREAFRAAQEYNESLYSVQLDPAAAVDEYDSLLNLSGNGIMGYVEIPVIDVNSPPMSFHLLLKNERTHYFREQISTQCRHQDFLLT